MRSVLLAREFQIDFFFLNILSSLGHVDVVRVLLKDYRVQPSVWCLCDAICSVDVVKILLDDGRVDPADQNNICLRLAALKGHIDVVKLLIDDHRVDERCAISPTTPIGVIHILIDDDRCGFYTSDKCRGLYEQHHNSVVTQYRSLKHSRTEQISAMTYCMKTIGNGWGDIHWPVSDIMNARKFDLDNDWKK